MPVSAASFDVLPHRTTALYGFYRADIEPYKLGLKFRRNVCVPLLRYTEVLVCRSTQRISRNEFVLAVSRRLCSRSTDVILMTFAAASASLAVR